MERIIETHYMGWTNTKNERIKAVSNDVNVIIQYPYTDGEEKRRHQMAADALIKKMGWKLEYVGGGSTKKGYAFLYRSND